MLICENLSLHVNDFHIAAETLALPPDVYAVLGPSGAGKSTLLSAIAGFLKPASGRILWNNMDITHLSPAQRPIGILFQDNNLFPHLTIHRNLALALTHKARITSDQDRAIGQALDRVGLTDLAQRKPADLSGGQQSRAALARVLLQNRPILALDEPFSALGPALKSEMLELVREIAQDNGTLVLMVTHDPSDAKQIAPQSILVADHVIHAPQRTHTMFEHPPEALARYLGRVTPS